MIFISLWDYLLKARITFHQIPLGQSSYYHLAFPAFYLTLELVKAEATIVNFAIAIWTEFRTGDFQRQDDRQEHLDRHPTVRHLGPQEVCRGGCPAPGLCKSKIQLL